MFQGSRIVALLCIVSVLAEPLAESQRLFSIAVGRVQHLHLLAQRLLSQFQGSLQVDEQRQLNKNFLQDFCNSDDIISPIDKHQTQRSSVLKLLSVSYRLVGSWEFPSRFLAAGIRNQIPQKLMELKTGIDLLIKVHQGSMESLVDPELFQLVPSGSFYQSARSDDSLQHSFELLACFKKDMHKVETYLTVAKCRLSPEDNCTL